ncbi:MAG: redox-regulated ATPase YchF [Candidatus Liptonbacteria bacterium]|nr:redox-regulated ATPase YchF [Candidatus Liptonbacteria bacterium]
MKLSLGIVGLPNVGKSTLFKALTKIDITIANYPFATIDPNVGIVTVPDERVDKLVELSKSKKKIPAIVEFYDIAGLVKGANKGEGLGNQFLSHIRETQAIVQVVRCFGGGEIIHVESNVNPLRDIETINTELMLKDLEVVEKRLKSAEGEAKTGKKDAIATVEILKKAKVKLEKGEMLRDLRDEPEIKELQLLTAKEILFLLNGKEDDVPDELKNMIKALGYSYLVADLSDHNFNLNPLIKKAYEILDLISFFTTGEDETRAWTIKRGTLAPQAAGVIHTDFENKFIRAEVVSYEALHASGGWQAAKQKGLLRLEGKDYVFQDGDVVVIRHG